jgi:hypothetical protein
MKALAKDPNERYQTAEALGEALLEYIASTRRPSAEKQVAALLGGTFGASLKERNQMILTAAEQLLRGETDPARLASPVRPPQTQTLTPDGGVERSAALTRKDTRPRRAITMAAAAASGALLIFAAWSMYGPRRVDSVKPSLAAATTPLVVPSPVLSVAPEASSAPVLGAAQADTPLPSSLPPAPRQGSSRVSTRPAPSSSSSTDAGALAKPTKKPRPIDRDNPFATH